MLQQSVFLDLLEGDLLQGSGSCSGLRGAISTSRSDDNVLASRFVCRRRSLRPANPVLESVDLSSNPTGFAAIGSDVIVVFAFRQVHISYCRSKRRSCLGNLPSQFLKMLERGRHVGFGDVFWWRV